ncbi:Tubulin-tyrosine ligase-like protein 12 [Coccomyxa sp. Obi]|nr:Tubulin-tyrosine ligase-like protein 12 [Coccomyxa sp. Obi]
MELPQGQEAGLAFVSFLRASEVPESLWEQILDRIERGDVGSQGLLQAVHSQGGPSKLVAGEDLTPTDSIFILPNVRAATRNDWDVIISTDAELKQSVVDTLPSGMSAAASNGSAALWRWVRPTMLAGSPSRAVTIFSLEAKEALWARHAENPNIAVVPLPQPVADAVDGGGAAPYGALLFWPLRPIKAGEELVRDHLPGPRSLQRAACLLYLLCEQDRWAHTAEYQGLKAALEAALAGQVPPGVSKGPPSALVEDQRSLPSQAVPGKQMTVWADYPLVKDRLTAPAFRIIDDREAADIIVTSTPVKDFKALPINQLVNQFPFEACLIRKDLLPQSLRRFHAAAMDVGAQAAPSGDLSADIVPSWFPTTYDLATEVHFFLQDYKKRAEAGQDNHWVVKLAQGTHSTDVCLTNCAELIVRYREAPGGDRVVQKYITKPVLYEGRKMDLRVYLVVRSFAEADAYLYRQWYARVANKEYGSDISATQTDFERHFTVACYDDDPSVSGAQLMVPRSEVVSELERQGIDVTDMEEQLCSMARNLVSAAQAQIGGWPRSRAVYGLDVMLASGTNGKCSPQLLEVNFCPDFTSLLKYGTEEAVNDFMMACFSSKPVSAERFQKLKEDCTDATPGLKELESID